MATPSGNPSIPRTLHLVDASPYIFRAYYSLPPSIRDVDGNPANAVRGFGDMIIRVIREARPTHLLVAFDGSLTTSFRNDIFPAYKSSRDQPDEDLVSQLDACYAICEAFGAFCCIDDRYEADDLVATAKERFRSEVDSIVVVTADKDLAQLVDETTVFHDFAKNVRLDIAGVTERYGVRPDQIRDLLGLAGDSVDDIPGVRGVGPKTATALLAEFDHMEDIYADLERVATLPIRGAKTLGAKLAEHRDIAYLSRELATCALDAPLDATLDQLVYRGADPVVLGPLLERLGLSGRLHAVPHRRAS